jgi:hypothetical protein
VNETTRKQVAERSGGRCEGFWMPPRSIAWARCTKPARHVHHKVTKGRGGALLDPWTIYHLAHLCPECHVLAHGPAGFTLGLMLPGSVITNKITDRPVYTGLDGYLTRHFGEEEAQ